MGKACVPLFGVLLFLLVLRFQISHCLSDGSALKSKGPRAPATPASLLKQSTNFRSRFTANSIEKNGNGSSSSSSSLKIVGGLSRAQNVLKRNPSPQLQEKSGETRLFSDRSVRYPGAQLTQPINLDESGDEEGVVGGGGKVYPSPSSFPVFSGQKPSYNGWNGPPTVISYQPGQGTLPPIVFPPIPLPTVDPGELPPEETEEPSPAPVGPTPSIPPPEGTIVPIIGGGGGDVDESTEEDIFPPSPPESEGVGRMLPLQGNPPIVRTRITNVAPVPPVPQNQSPQGKSRIKVRLRDKVKASFETSVEDGGVGNVGRAITKAGSDPNIITDFVFSDIKCYKSRSGEYFGTTIHMKSGYHPPYVRDRPQDPLTSNECRMEAVAGAEDAFHLSVSDLRGCGVEQCGEYMCLTMVFPRVPTLALADDEVTTIKCLPQKSTMSDTRTVNFAGDSLDGRRSSSTVEGGGQEFAAEVGVFRQNPGMNNGLFVKRVNSGGVVQLGEMLQLRSIVRGGDGWKHSKLSDVKVWRMRDNPGNLDNLDPNDATEVITLVDGNGCRNPVYQVIAERQPIKDPRNDLINHFTFKAFLFRGQRANEPLIVTAKIHACIDLDCVPKHCDSRRKRSPVEVTNSSAIVHDWDTRVALRVVGFKDHPTSLTEDDFSSGRSLSTPMTCGEKMASAGVGGGLIVLLLCGMTFALYSYIIKGQRDSSGGKQCEPYFLSSYRQQQQHIQNHQCPAPQYRKPLPPPPASQEPAPPPQPSPPQTQEDKISKSDLSNVSKILQKLADKREGSEEQQTEYECIDERSTKKNPAARKKSDGVYILYIDKNKNRPKSAPSSIRSKSGKLSRKQLKQILDSGEESPCSPTEDSSEDSSSGSSASPQNVKKCVGFAGRRTVRNVKSRSSHHNPKENRVVKGIRRRLSSLYNGNKGGSPSFRGRTLERGQSSDLDSAYYGSELTDHYHHSEVLQDIREIATATKIRNAASKRFDKEQEQVKMQYLNNNSISSGKGQTQTHFVTRNDTSTQILIVPETHV